MGNPIRNFDAALIAGGRSTRFGSDKAFAEWKGQPLYAFQLRKLARLHPSRLFLSSNSRQPFPEVLEGVARVNDTWGAMGPAGALLSVFSESRADWVVVLPVDLPLMEESFLNRLLADGGGRVPLVDGGWEPLVGVYPREKMLPILQEAVDSNRLRMQDLVEQAKAKGLIAPFEIRKGEREYFLNVNTEGDFAAAEKGEFDEVVQLDRYRTDEGKFSQVLDRIAVEEPLEIRVNGRSISVMMRTPGHDEELVAGFLYTEGVISGADEIQEIARCPDVDPEGRGNTLDVRIENDPDWDSLTRHVFASSSCGVCGKATIESVFQNFPPVGEATVPDPAILLSLSSKLRESQETFEKTGGLHASAIFNREGVLQFLREDVGRHNALDKVIGHALGEGIDLSECILLVSGRVSFELMQKALAARIPVVAGISAPSSLAVSLAKRSGQVLVGFLRDRGFNLYHQDG